MYNQVSTQHRNYGLSGLSTDEYDDFLGLGRKAKAKRASKRKHRKEKRKLRREKKQLKNDQRRAETEALRAESNISQGLFSPVATPSVTNQPTAPVQTYNQPPTLPNIPLAQASMLPPTTPPNNNDDNGKLNNKHLLFIGGVIAVGVVIYTLK